MFRGLGILIRLGIGYGVLSNGGYLGSGFRGLAVSGLGVGFRALESEFWDLGRLGFWVLVSHFRALGQGVGSRV